MTPPRSLTPVEVQVLRAVNRFRYLTAAQLNRVLWPDNTRDANRYSQRRLAALARAGYLQVLTDLPRPSNGRAPYVYTLAWRGRQLLVELGEPVPRYYRPSEREEAARNALFMPHTLAIVDVLVAVERLTQEVPDVTLARLLLEGELRQLKLSVTLPAHNGGASRRVTVVPDALFAFSHGGATQYFLLEVDRGTERQRIWRAKTAAPTCWVASAASRTLVPSEYVTVVVVTTDRTRREQLRTWTADELAARGLYEEYASLYAISEVSAVATQACDFFGGAHWYPPYTGSPDSLIDVPHRQGLPALPHQPVHSTTPIWNRNASQVPVPARGTISAR